MPKVIRSPEAAEDLLEIWRYIAERQRNGGG